MKISCNSTDAATFKIYSLNSHKPSPEYEAEEGDNLGTSER